MRVALAEQEQRLITLVVLSFLSGACALYLSSEGYAIIGRKQALGVEIIIYHGQMGEPDI